MRLRRLDLWPGRGHEAALLTDVNGKGCWLTLKTGERSGYPVASASLSRSRPGGRGPAGAPDALNELDPYPQVCYASGANATGYPRAGDPSPSRPTLKRSRSEACQRHMFDRELGNPLMVPWYGP
jgi:hypothetical protein